MENFIDYLMYALLGHNYIVKKNAPYWIGYESWEVILEDRVYFCLDESDLNLLRYIRDNRKLDDEEKARYDKLFSLCV